MTVKDGTCQMPLRMVRVDYDMRLVSFPCGIYVARWGAGANSASAGYQEPPPQAAGDISGAKITYTIDSSTVSYYFSGRVWLIFTGKCYGYYGFQGLKNRIELTTNSLTGTLEPFTWGFKDAPNVANGVENGDRVYISDEYVSQSSGLCYSDMSPFTNIPIRAGTIGSQWDGTLSLSVTSVE
jgi:hypothetical protein